jgi:predicted dinucleotide-binding enzyme
MARIGVTGSGNIGATLGEAWRRAGHDVAFGSRSPAPPPRRLALRLLAG